MFAISAADAISPAIQRTRTFLFQPFRLGTYLKLCLVAVLTEGFGGSFQFSSPVGGHTSQGTSSPHPGPHTPAALTHGWIAALIAISVVVILLSFILYYLITRLRFAYFHCLIHNTKQIRPGWNLYRAQATRFFWMNVVVGFCYLLAAALVVLPFAIGLWRLIRSIPPGGHPDVGSLLSLFLPFIPLFFLLVLVAVTADIVLRDFMLPHYAMENATAGHAWRAVWNRMMSEKGSFFVYFLLRIILPLVGLIVLFAVCIIPGILFIAMVAAVEYGIHTAFVDAATVRIFIEVLVGIVAFVIAFLVGIGIGGPLSTAIRQYALLFYGSRYRPLGDILVPPTQGPNAPAVT